MEKKLYMLMWIIAFWMLVFWLNMDVNSEESLEQLVQRVADDYTREQWFNWQCSIDWTPVTLAQFIYWIWHAEWGFNPKWAWYRTNNVWSLRRWMWLKKVINYEQFK